MLEYGDKDLFAQFLINIGFGETEYSCNIRYRVFRILQTVIDTPMLEELTKQDIYTFRYRQFIMNTMAEYKIFILH